MCQRILQFCSGSTKPLLFAGGFLSLLLVASIGYIDYTTNALYSDIDPEVVGYKSLFFHLQLVAAVCLSLVTVLSCYAAYYDQKHSVRVLFVITTFSFVLALAAIFVIPSSQDLSKPFEATLEKAADNYNFTYLPLHSTEAKTINIAKANISTEEPRDMAATRMWDSLQARGCCGVHNATIWEKKEPKLIPKSCCESPIKNASYYQCKEVDANHQQGCVELIGSTIGLNLLVVLALVALVNFYLATISGINAYKTYSYSEASQNAYT